MSFASKHKREKGNFISKKNAYKVFGEDYLYRVTNVMFRKDQFASEPIPHVTVYLPEGFEYEDGQDKIRTCEPGEYIIKLSDDMTDEITDILGDPDSMSDITHGLVGMRIYKYLNANLNKMCYGITWVDVDEEGNEVFEG